MAEATAMNGDTATPTAITTNITATIGITATGNKQVGSPRCLGIRKETPIVSIILGDHRPGASRMPIHSTLRSSTP
jgi:hypothetical protein